MFFECFFVVHGKALNARLYAGLMGFKV